MARRLSCSVVGDRGLPLRRRTAQDRRPPAGGESDLLPFLLSLVSVVNYLPWLLFGLAGGAVADRVDRQTAMWVTDLLRGALGCVLAVLVATGHAGMGALMLVGFALSSLQTLFDSASTSMLPSVVPADELTVANGRLSVARTIAETLVGAAVAATLFGAAPLPFVLDAVSFLAAAVLVLRLRLPRPPGQGPTAAARHGHCARRSGRALPGSAGTHRCGPCAAPRGSPAQVWAPTAAPSCYS